MPSSVKIAYGTHHFPDAYELDSKGEPIDFIAADPPSIPELEQILGKTIKKLTHYLEKQNIIVKDDTDNFQIAIPDDD